MPSVSPKSSQQLLHSILPQNHASFKCTALLTQLFAPSYPSAAENAHHDGARIVGPLNTLFLRTRQVEGYSPDRCPQINAHYPTSKLAVGINLRIRLGQEENFVV